MSYKSTILIVDDEPVMREILEGLLLPQGYNLAFADGGNSALEKAATLTPDLILLDVMMPDIDGFEVCRRLRTDPLLAEVPVIMITALDDRESRLQGIEVGADDFVTKPIDVAELQTRVQTIVRLDRYRRLLSERTKFEWVVEQAADGYLLLSEQTDILYANAQARFYLGLPLDENEPIPHTFLDLIESKYVCEPQAAWTNWPQQSAGRLPLYLVQPETETTEAFWLQVELMDMVSRSDERYLVSLRDITPSVVMRQVMWSFHDQVGHKLKTPLTLLAGSLELLKEDASTKLGPEETSILEMAHKNALRLQDGVKSIFEYMQGPATTKLGPTHCCLAEIEAIVNKTKTNLELASISLAFDLENADSRYLSLTCQAIEQVLRELMTNAKKFHPDQAPQIDIKLDETDEGIRLQIIDDGLNLSPDQLAKLWTPYYQAEKYFSGQVPGMGLGLSTVASMVWSVGGTCHASNRTDGPGIMVEVVIPLIDVQTS